MCSSLNPQTMVINGSLLSVFSCTTPEFPSTSKHVKRRNQDHNITLRVDWKSIAMLFSIHFLILMSPLLYISPMTSDPGARILKTIGWTPKKDKCGCGKVNSTLDFRLEPEPYCWLNQIEHELPWMSSQDFKGPFFNCRCISLIEMWAKSPQFVFLGPC